MFYNIQRARGLEYKGFYSHTNIPKEKQRH